MKKKYTKGNDAKVNIFYIKKRLNSLKSLARSCTLQSAPVDHLQCLHELENYPTS